MKIAVIAANGRTGQAFVKAALAAGHEVRAGSLKTGQLPSHPNLTEVVCDATNREQLGELIKGQDAVASFIGHVKGSPASVQTTAIEAATDVMRQFGVKRIVSLTGTGVRFPGDKVTLIDRFLNLGVSIVDPERVNDGRMHVEALKKSNLDWTVIRVLKLQNIAAKPFELKQHGPTKLMVGRDEVARAALRVLEGNLFIQKAPIISHSKTLV